MALSNLALKSNLNAIFTTVGATAIGFDSVAALRPADFTPVSGASAITITLPPARLTATALGAGQANSLQFGNLAAQAVSIVAASGDSILGSSATIAQNATATYIADAANNRWFRLGA